MTLAVLCRPNVDRLLAAKVALWVDKHMKRDTEGRTDAEFYIWGDDH